MAPLPLDEIEARADRVIELTREGHSTADIADILHITQRSVTRIRARRGVSLCGPARPLTDDELATARRLLEDGASYAEVARTIGRGKDVLKKHFPGYSYTPAQCAEASRLAQLMRWACR